MSTPATIPMRAAELRTDERGIAIPPEGYHELLAELLTDAATMLVSGGLESARANELAWNITELIRDRWGGQTLYIPQGLTFETLQRYESIWRAFTGDNVPELARQYDMSKMAVYRALAIMRERDRRARQGDLFGQQQQPEAA